MSNSIDLRHYLPADSAEDATPGLREALRVARTMENPVLSFPPGVWHCWPDKAVEKHYFISNNDNGLKRAALPLVGFENITIEGNGAELMIHGRMTPVIVDNSSYVTIRGLTFDAPIPFYGQALITDAGKDFFELEIDSSRFAGRVEGRKLVFDTPEWDYEPNDGLFLEEFDPERIEPAYFRGHRMISFQGKSKDCCASGNEPVVEAVQVGDRIRLTGEVDGHVQAGNLLFMGFEKRNNPCIFAVDSRNLVLEDLNIYHSASMGVIAQLTENITLRRVKMEPRPGSGRVVAIVADATHYVNCSGDLVMEDCVFENMMDDATNIHGIYTTVSELLPPDRIEVRYHHFQQWGVNLYRPGDTVRFISRQDFTPKADLVVKSVEIINCQYALLTFTTPIPEAISLADAVELPGKMPADVVLRNCRCGNNRSRGFLINTPGKVLVEGCEFHNSGHGLQIAGDANFWFESGPVRDVTIRDCFFREVGYGYNGMPLSCEPEVDVAHCPPFHRNVIIENNTFLMINSNILRFHSCDGLIFRGNKMSQSEAYPFYQWDNPSIVTKGCCNVTVEQPVATQL